MRVFKVIHLVVGILFIFIYPLVFSFSKASDRDEPAEYWFRIQQISLYAWLLVQSMATAGFFMVTLKRKQYLAFEEHKTKLAIHAAGMLCFIVLNMIHVVINIQNYRREIENELNPNLMQLIYIGSEIGACSICLLAKITHDLFVELNRDKSILRVSTL